MFLVRRSGNERSKDMTCKEFFVDSHDSFGRLGRLELEEAIQCCWYNQMSFVESINQHDISISCNTRIFAFSIRQSLDSCSYAEYRKLSAAFLAYGIVECLLDLY